MDCLTKFNSPQLKTLHRGKVRDSIRIDDQTRMIVVTDRISAFNKKIKTPIPTKGAVLNGIANFWFDQTKHIVDNHIIQQVDDYITLVKEAVPIRVEMVVRAYLTGSMWRGYEAGQRTFSGVTVGDGMVKNQRFEHPILTPTTKDEDDTEIDEQGILGAGLVSAPIYDQMKEKALAIFNFASIFLGERGIILVDTKYEFGLLDGQLIIIDEMHTPDSSRFWSADDYAKNPTAAAQIDKEFVRQWMLSNKVNGEVPLVLIPEIIAETSNRYQEIYNTVTGQVFNLVDMPSKVRVYHNLVKAGVLKTAVVAIVMDNLSQKSEAARLEKELAAYDLCVQQVLLADIDELSATYNQTIEPVAIIALGQTQPTLDAHMTVPITSNSKDALRGLNLHALRTALDK